MRDPGLVSPYQFDNPAKWKQLHTTYYKLHTAHYILHYTTNGSYLSTGGTMEHWQTAISDKRKLYCDNMVEIGNNCTAIKYYIYSYKSKHTKLDKRYYTTHYTIPTTPTTLQTTKYTLQSTHYTLHTSHYTPHTTHYTLHL